MNNDSQIDFSEKLIKGRIAETIFEQMLRDTDAFTILSFGYEKILPELAHHQHDVRLEDTMKIIKRAPDFAVINNDTHEVHLIEVKYLKQPRTEYILDDAKKMFQTWKPSYLFLATPNGFLFDKASEIIKNEGKMHKLEHVFIPQELQDKYTKLLNEFINPNK